jgi:hypothetical protein
VLGPQARPCGLVLDDDVLLFDHAGEAVLGDALERHLGAGFRQEAEALDLVGAAQAEVGLVEVVDDGLEHAARCRVLAAGARAGDGVAVGAQHGFRLGAEQHLPVGSVGAVAGVVPQDLLAVDDEEAVADVGAGGFARHGLEVVHRQRDGAGRGSPTATALADLACLAVGLGSRATASGQAGYQQHAGERQRTSNVQTSSSALLRLPLYWNKKRPTVTRASGGPNGKT